MLEKTEYYHDFIKYYGRAKMLNLRNIGKLPSSVNCGDELQQNVTIYDTVWRRYAGFSKVLEQLWYGPESWTLKKSNVAHKNRIGVKEWLYICLVHRLTGSGASFEKDHGYRNTAVIEMVETQSPNLENYIQFLRKHDKPMFTSIGNQIPPFNKPTILQVYKTGGKEFLCVHAPKLANYISTIIIDKKKIPKQYEIKEMVDLVLEWMVANGFKRYVFVLTAWIMDIAEYYPQYVNQDSDVYIGKNCSRALDLMYIRKDINKKDFYDLTLKELSDELDNKPYNIEDVLCDAIRYWANYIPKNYENYYEANLRTVPRIALN